MATADLSFDMRINGTPEEVASILEVMLEYNEGKNGAYFSCTSITIGDKKFHLSSGLCNKEELAAAVNSNSGTAEISALGPFGKYYEIDNVDILRDMAKAAPNAHFTASIAGNAGYADQSLSAELANGKMHVSTFYLSDDARGEAMYDYYKKYLPYEKFIELFRIDGEQFDEETYEDFTCDGFDCYEDLGDYFAETEYEEFIDTLSDYDVECPLTEEEYDEVAQEFIVMDYEPIESFLEDGGYAQCNKYTFDPADENNSGDGKMKMVPGVAYSINDNIREHLDSIGHPSDDETISALSVEDVYSILAGTYGKTAPTEDEECESDEAELADDTFNADKCAEDEEISEDCAEEESDEDDSDEDDSDEDDSDEEDSDNQDAVESETVTDDVVTEVVTADTAETEPEMTVEAEPETEEEDNKTPTRKKSFPVWLIVLLIAVILVGIPPMCSVLVKNSAITSQIFWASPPFSEFDVLSYSIITP